jgi:hypothetical protein
MTPHSEKVQRASALRKLAAGRTTFRFGGDEFVRHAEEVAQHVWSDAAEADQNHGKRDVVVGDVVDVGCFGEQVSAVVDVDADRERAGLCGRIYRGASQQLAMNFEGASAVRGRFLDARKFEGDFSHGIEIGGAFRHGNLRGDYLAGGRLSRAMCDVARDCCDGEQMLASGNFWVRGRPEEGLRRK